MSKSLEKTSEQTGATDLAGDVALIADSLSQCLGAIAYLRPDIAHSFAMQAKCMAEISDRLLKIAAGLQ